MNVEAGRFSLHSAKDLKKGKKPGDIVVKVTVGSDSKPTAAQGKTGAGVSASTQTKDGLGGLATREEAGSGMETVQIPMDNNLPADVDESALDKLEEQVDPADLEALGRHALDKDKFVEELLAEYAKIGTKLEKVEQHFAAEKANVEQQIHAASEQSDGVSEAVLVKVLTLDEEMKTLKKAVHARAIEALDHAHVTMMNIPTSHGPGDLLLPLAPHAKDHIFHELKHFVTQQKVQQMLGSFFDQMHAALQPGGMHGEEGLDAGDPSSVDDLPHASQNSGSGMTAPELDENPNHTGEGPVDSSASGSGLDGAPPMKTGYSDGNYGEHSAAMERRMMGQGF